VTETLKSGPRRTAFLFRFAEVTPTRPTDEQRGKTTTFVEKEKPDEGRVVPLNGTRTITETRWEDADADVPSRCSYYVLPLTNRE